MVLVVRFLDPFDSRNSGFDLFEEIAKNIPIPFGNFIMGSSDGLKKVVIITKASLYQRPKGWMLTPHGLHPERLLVIAS